MTAETAADTLAAMNLRQSQAVCMDLDCVCTCHLPPTDDTFGARIHPRQATINDYLGEHPPYLDPPDDAPDDSPDTRPV